LSVAMRLSFFS